MSKKKIDKIVLSIIILLIIFVLETYAYFSDSPFAFLKASASEQVSNSNSNVTEVLAETRTIENTLSSSGQVSSALDEKLSLHASYYFDELLIEENQYVGEGTNILKYTNGTYLTAPYDCVLISYNLPKEDEICTTSHYIEVQSLHTLSMKLSISESDINKVSVGDVVDVTLTSTGDMVKGNITSISEVGTYSSSGSYFTSTVTFINNGNFKIGMSASCEIVVESAENAVSLPVDAVQTSDNGKYVIVVNDDGTTVNQTVETGISNDNYIEIKSGITEGTKVQMQNSESSTSNRNGFNFSNFGGGEGRSSGRGEQVPQMPEGAGFNGGGPGGQMP